MANPQLLDYLRTQAAKGWKKDDLLAAVRKAGWQESAIQEAVREMEPPVRNIPPPIAQKAPTYAPQQPIEQKPPERVPPIQPKPAAIPASFPPATAPIRTSFPPIQNPAPASTAPAARPVSQPAYSPRPEPAKIAPVQASPLPAPVKSLPHGPIAIDASGNPTTAAKIAVPEPIAIEVGADAEPAAFGIPQRPQMQMRPQQAHVFPSQKAAPLPAPAIPAQPAFSASQVMRPEAPATVTPPSEATRVSVPTAAPAMPAAVMPVAMPAQSASPAGAAAQPRSINLLSREPSARIPVMPAMEHDPVEPMPSMSPVSFPRSAAPTFPEPKAEMPRTMPAGAMTVRMNPAFIPGARPAASGIPPQIQQQPAAMAVSINPATSAAAKPVLHASAGIAAAGAFQGMRPGAISATGILPVQQPRISMGAGILPQGRPMMQARPVPAAAEIPPKKKSRKLLAFFIIILMLAAGGAFAYFEFPAAVEQAQNSVQALIPGNAPQPGAVLANALTKLLSTSQFGFKGTLAGTLASDQDPQSAVSMKGTISGSVASILPFPSSQDSASVSVFRAGQTAPSLAASANILTSAGQGAFFRLNAISGTDDANGTYDSLKNIWISIDPAALGADRIAAIFGSQAFATHQDQIRNIIIRSQIFAVASVSNDDPGSGLYHYGIAIQKDRILPAILQIAQIMGVAVSSADQAGISDAIQSANFPILEAWISQSSQTVNRMRMSVTRSGQTAQSFSFDVSLLPLVGNPPAIIAPEGAVPLQEALNPSPAPAPAAPAKKPAAKK